jgi:hypothetical protein
MQCITQIVSPSTRSPTSSPNKSQDEKPQISKKKPSIFDKKPTNKTTEKENQDTPSPIKPTKLAFDQLFGKKKK